MNLTKHGAYVAQIKGMADRIRKKRSEGRDLRFVMPPKEFMVVAGLDQLGDRLTRSDEARALVRVFAQEEPIPTVFMLRVALDLAGLSCDTVTLGELGLAARA